MFIQFLCFSHCPTGGDIAMGSDCCSLVRTSVAHTRCVTFTVCFVSTLLCFKRPPALSMRVTASNHAFQPVAVVLASVGTHRGTDSDCGRRRRRDASWYRRGGHCGGDPFRVPGANPGANASQALECILELTQTNFWGDPVEASRANPGSWSAPQASEHILGRTQVKLRRWSRSRACRETRREPRNASWNRRGRDRGGDPFGVSGANPGACRRCRRASERCLEHAWKKLWSVRRAQKSRPRAEHLVLRFWRDPSSWWCLCPYRRRFSWPCVATSRDAATLRGSCKSAWLTIADSLALQTTEEIVEEILSGVSCAGGLKSEARGASWNTTESSGTHRRKGRGRSCVANHEGNCGGDPVGSQQWCLHSSGSSFLVQGHRGSSWRVLIFSWLKCTAHQKSTTQQPMREHPTALANMRHNSKPRDASPNTKQIADNPASRSTEETVEVIRLGLNSDTSTPCEHSSGGPFTRRDIVAQTSKLISTNWKLNTKNRELRATS